MATPCLCLVECSGVSGTLPFWGEGLGKLLTPVNFPTGLDVLGQSLVLRCQALRRPLLAIAREMGSWGA